MTNGFEHTVQMGESGTRDPSVTDHDPSANEARTVVVYGGANDVGGRAVGWFLDSGATVVVLDEPHTRRSVTSRFGAAVDFFPVNVASPESIANVAARVSEGYDAIDLLASTKSVVSDPDTSSGTPDRTYLVNHLAVYQLYYHLEDRLLHSRILVPVHPLLFETDQRFSLEATPTSARASFLRSQYANAALVVGLHIQHWDRTANGYDPGFVVHDDGVERDERIRTDSEPEVGADRLVHVSGAATAGILRGGYYGGTVEEIQTRLDAFEQEFNMWDVPTPAEHKLPVSDGDCETVLDYDATHCGVDSGWTETDAWWIEADRGPTGY